ncbi:ATP-binding cassette domain-containing protein [Corynebacterium propinquum]|uniref:ATP-binding cassette domain-containing protein n=1 Tax=Corynebacterium propinquum TaxID=43769 RepID=UPI00254F463B|nr:ABC transporter ATP-binding protein [Corynebacterium propinquum]MDK8536655.1 ABC transporter ATP-binding protein [Corynebacterium propinquum]
MIPVSFYSTVYPQARSEEPKISFRNVDVRYGKNEILTDLNANIYGPGLCSIIGANGSGKTTLLKIACGLSLPSSGEIFVNGLSTKDNWGAVRTNMGVSLYSERSYHFRLTGKQNIVYFGRLNGIKKAHTLEKVQVLSRNFSIEPLLERKFSDLSLGQRKIFGMIVAFVFSGDIVVLDEPTATLDNQNSRAVSAMILWGVDQGKTILITTHDQSLVEQSHQVITL